MYNPVEFFDSTKAAITRAESSRDPRKLTPEEIALLGGKGRTRTVVRKRKPAPVSVDPEDSDDGSIKASVQVVDDTVPEFTPSTEFGDQLGVNRDHHEFIAAQIFPETFEKLKTAVAEWNALVQRFEPQLNPVAVVNQLKQKIGCCRCPNELQDLNSKLIGIQSQDRNSQMAAECVCNAHLSEKIDPLVTQAWKEIFASLLASFESAKELESGFFKLVGLPWNRTVIFENLEAIHETAKAAHAQTGHWLDPETCRIPKRSMGLHRPECANWLLAGREN